MAKKKVANVPPKLTEIEQDLLSYQLETDSLGGNPVLRRLTTPNTVTSAIHDRMPVILDPDSYDLWLDPGMRNVAAISELLKPYDARLMRCFPVSTRVNHVANDGDN